MTSTQCSFRKKMQLFNEPPPRYEVVTPYPEYTEHDLNMRRKAEVLQHKSDGFKHNGTTKAEIYSKLVNRNITKTTGKYDKCIFADALNVKSRTLPNYYSDVPGPTTMLYNDPKIPLYMMSNDKPTPSIILPQDLNQTILNIEQYGDY